MYRSGLVDTLVTHANMKGLGLTPLFGDRRGFMPPQLKTKKQTNKINENAQNCHISGQHLISFHICNGSTP